jgi:hypothetical protein
VQNNKQSLSSFKRKTAEGIDDLRPPDANNRINARWTNDEMLLAVQGKALLSVSLSEVLKYIFPRFKFCQVQITLRYVELIVIVCVILTKCPLKFCVYFIDQMGCYVPLNVTLYGQKGKHCPRQVQAWAFKMKITPAFCSYIRI